MKTHGMYKFIGTSVKSSVDDDFYNTRVVNFSVSTGKLTYKQRLRRHPKLTCIIGGQCVDGVVLVSDSKVTYEDHPPSYEPKLHSEFYHIVTGGADSVDLYKGFRTNALFAMQSGTILPEDIRLELPLVYESTEPVQISGIVHMYSS